jgi:hypothetical protein
VLIVSAGDHGVIAKETARMLGLGTNIPDAAGLPTMDADGKIPKDLGKKYGKMILEADGFAQVGHSPGTVCCCWLVVVNFDCWQEAS